MQSDHRVSPGVGAEGLEATSAEQGLRCPAVSRKSLGTHIPHALSGETEKAGVAADSADERPRRHALCRNTHRQPAEPHTGPGPQQPQGPRQQFHLSSEEDPF